MSFDIPPELAASLQRLSVGVSRRDLIDHAAAMSDIYRSGGTSRPITSREHALAYAMVRMPATYAAVAACLAAMREIKPDFAPSTLLDVGAGPGTAAWAAADALPSLSGFASVDANAALRQLALDLAADHSRLAGIDYRQGAALGLLKAMPAADLVIASYVLGEIADADRGAFADALLAQTGDTLLVVEPGTPAGYARVIALRARLIAAGLHVIAPCPHDQTCPLLPPDWCHFAQRVQRSRDHKQIKGAELPFEDEKYSYVALTRTPVAPARARVLRQPEMSKAGIGLKLCGSDGLTDAFVPRRDKTQFKRFRKAAWGDAVFENK